MSIRMPSAARRPPLDARTGPGCGVVAHVVGVPDDVTVPGARSDSCWTPPRSPPSSGVRSAESTPNRTSDPREISTFSVLAAVVTAPPAPGERLQRERLRASSTVERSRAPPRCLRGRYLAVDDGDRTTKAAPVGRGRGVDVGGGAAYATWRVPLRRGWSAGRRGLPRDGLQSCATSYTASRSRSNSRSADGSSRDGKEPNLNGSRCTAPRSVAASSSGPGEHREVTARTTGWTATSTSAPPPGWSGEDDVLRSVPGSRLGGRARGRCRRRVRARAGGKQGGRR